ncbi:PREDICTED: uncharacterized protein LOC108354016, partial [Rhagoletis zephyria]|uniref:uncharacterized protein LOC108354016 n=1 Tax=Rhagoletis zephyria TaxID=28612 RepID=UPI0008113355
LTIALVIILAKHESHAVCSVCNGNGVACASNITFQLCFNGIPDTTVTYNCLNDNEVCTALGRICIDSSSNPNIQAACGDTKQCGQCRGIANGAYTCTSRTTFTMCTNNNLTSVRGSCRSGMVCRTSVAHSGQTPCVSECLSDVTDMCDVGVAVDAPPNDDSAITTVIFQPTPSLTTVATSTGTSSTATTYAEPTSSSQSPVASCSDRTQVGRYPNTADSGCSSYLYCLNSVSGLVGRIMSCPAGKYFNSDISNCQSTKPNGCV